MPIVLALLLAAGQKWSLVCGGDIMLNSLKVSESRLVAISPYFRAANLGLANLEVPLTTAKYATTRKDGKDLKAKTQFTLKGNPAQAKLFKAWGFKVLTQGNNHAMDFREQGLKQMLAALDRNGISHTGAGVNVDQAWRPATCEVAPGYTASVGAALAFAGKPNAFKCTPATYSSAGVATLTFDGRVDQAARTHIRHLIERLRKNGGPVIMCPHWGEERMTVPREYQVELGRACIDEGADAVIGAHPHVLQGAELYKGRPILYSMGNLISPMPADCGLIRLAFSGRKLESFRFIPFYNAGGVARMYKPTAEKAEDARFKSLSLAIAKKYPNKDSKPLY